MVSMKAVPLSIYRSKYAQNPLFTGEIPEAGREGWRGEGGRLQGEEDPRAQQGPQQDRQTVREGSIRQGQTSTKGDQAFPMNGLINLFNPLTTGWFFQFLHCTLANISINFQSCFISKFEDIAIFEQSDNQIVFISGLKPDATKVDFICYTKNV